MVSLSTVFSLRGEDFRLWKFETTVTSWRVRESPASQMESARDGAGIAADGVSGNVHGTGVEDQPGLAVLGSEIKRLGRSELLALFRKNRHQGGHVDRIVQHVDAAGIRGGTGEQRNREKVNSPVLRINMGDRSAAVGNGLTVEIRILDDLNAGASAHEKTDGGNGEGEAVLFLRSVQDKFGRVSRPDIGNDTELFARMGIDGPPDRGRNAHRFGQPLTPDNDRVAVGEQGARGENEFLFFGVGADKTRDAGEIARKIERGDIAEPLPASGEHEFSDEC